MNSLTLSPRDVTFIVVALNQRSARLHQLADSSFKRAVAAAPPGFSPDPERMADFRSFRDSGNAYAGLAARIANAANGTALAVEIK